MDFLKLVRARYSVRQYQNRPVEPEKVEQLLEAAQAAPTAANCQPVRLLVVETPDGRRRLAGAAELYGAPLAVVVCADRSRAWKRPFDGKQTTDIDASILTDHMMLAASALGLGSVWICYFQPEAVKAALGLMGICGDDLRLPLTPMEPEQRERLAEVMKRQGISLKKELHNQTNLL